MNNHNLTDFGKAVSRSISDDSSAQIKQWIASQDPNGKKLLKYREGIKKSLGHVQIMGMASPRELDTLYIALTATTEIQRERKLPTRSHGETEMQVLREIRQIQGTPIGTSDDDDLRKEIRNIQYESSSQTVARKFLQEIRNFQDARLPINIEEALESIGYDRVDGDDDDDDDDYGDHDLKEKLEEQAATISHDDRSQHGIDALKLVEEYRHLVVLGQPGSGKTTFLKYLALGYFGFVPTPIPLDPCIPIFVPLRELSRVDTPSPTAKWLFDFAASCACDICDERLSSAWLRTKFREGKCILLLDGVDEVSPKQAGNILQSITAFRNKYHGNRIVVTCRSAAFRYGLEGFQLCEIDDFNDDDIGNFANHWFGNSAASTCFLSDVRKGSSSRALCKTPLLLTLLCIQYDYYRSIPQNRSELYGTCIDALMFRWDTYRAIQRPNLSERLSPGRKKRLLVRLARDSFDKDIYFFNTNTLVRYLASELDKYDFANIDPGQVLDELESHHGILVERASDLHCFAHLTFQEFFCAQSYAANNELHTLFHKAVEDHRYREVFLLALEHSLDPDPLVFSLAALVKRECIDRNVEDFYLAQLIDDVAKANIPMSRKLRRVLREIRLDFDMINIE